MEEKLQDTEEGRWRLNDTKKRLDRWTAEQFDEKDALAEGEMDGAAAEDAANEEQLEGGSPDDAHGDISVNDQRDEMQSENFLAYLDMGMLAKDFDEGQRRELMAKDREIALLVKQLGGDDRAYRRERGRALRATVAEMIICIAALTAPDGSHPSSGDLHATEKVASHAAADLAEWGDLPWRPTVCGKTTDPVPPFTIWPRPDRRLGLETLP